MDLSAVDIRDVRIAKKVLGVQRAAYAVEAKLIGSREIPQLSETLEELRSCGETFLAWFDGEDLAGAVSYRLTEDTLDVHRLVVHPRFFRRGIASALLEGAEAAGVAAGLRFAIVSTGAANEPARRLYERRGYAAGEEHEVVAGLRVRTFRKNLLPRT